MSVNEIIPELPKLERNDLERVDARPHELLDVTKRNAIAPEKTVGQVLLEFAGGHSVCPQNSTNLDRYLYSVPKL